MEIVFVLKKRQIKENKFCESLVQNEYENIEGECVMWLRFSFLFFNFSFVFLSFMIHLFFYAKCSAQNLYLLSQAKRYEYIHSYNKSENKMNYTYNSVFDVANMYIFIDLLYLSVNFFFCFNVYFTVSSRFTRMFRFS